MVRKLAVASVVLLAAAFLVPKVLAQPAVDVNVGISGVRLVGECSQPAPNDPAQLWEVSTHIAVHNNTGSTVTFRDTEFWVKYSGPTASNQIQTDVSVVDYGGFVAGAQVPSQETSTFDPVLRVSLPCDTTTADMFAGLHIVGNDTQFVGSGTFIDGATPVPAGPTGVFGLAFLVGTAGFLAQRLGRRPKPLLAERA
jgi:hypothetical protein